MTAQPQAQRWKPNPGPQDRFIRCGAFEVLYGGAAGGGKSAAITMAALRGVARADYRALLLRRTLPELEGSLLDRAREWYPRHAPGARFNAQKHTWEFPSGARIRFGYCEHEGDETRYQGDEYQFLGFDELTHFTERQYLYLLSRLRAGRGMQKLVRATTNPGGRGHDWVFRRWGAWLDPQAPTHADGGAVLYFTADDRAVPRGSQGALGRTFIPARIADNPALALGDPEYAQRLARLDPVTRAQLLEGNWLARPAAGVYFKRAWWRWLDARPEAAARRVRSWDLASSPTGDYTAGVRLAHLPGAAQPWVVEDVVRLRGTPHEVRSTILATAALDGRDVAVTVPQDPGQAGVEQAQSYATALAGFVVRARRPTGDKVTRAGAFSAQVQAGNVALVRGAWNEGFVQELEGFPDGEHDDQVDAASDAFNELCAAPDRGPVPEPPTPPSDDPWGEQHGF